MRGASLEFRQQEFVADIVRWLHQETSDEGPAFVETFRGIAIGILQALGPGIETNLSLTTKL